jgi:hypothetical protein
MTTRAQNRGREIYNKNLTAATATPGSKKNCQRDQSSLPLGAAPPSLTAGGTPVSRSVSRSLSEFLAAFSSPPLVPCAAGVLVLVGAYDLFLVPKMVVFSKIVPTIL